MLGWGGACNISVRGLVRNERLNKKVITTISLGVV